MMKAETLRGYLFSHHYNVRQGEACSCQRGARTTACHECFQYEISCEVCFLEQHLHTPFHWAHVWNDGLGFFEKKDLSRLRESEPFFIQIGHDGQPCPYPHPSLSKPGLTFSVTTTNGMHTTRVRFCGCSPAGVDKVAQLMQARLFPSTTNDPQSAFTFTLLKHLQLHKLQAKCSTYECHAALQRSTDNMFPFQVNVGSPSLEHAFDYSFTLTEHVQAA